MSNLNYKTQFSFIKRLNESTTIIEKYPDRIPVICERYGNNIDLLDKKKYLVPKNLTLGQFIIIIRKRLNISKEQAIFCFINNKLPIISSEMSTLYKENKDEDGFLYLVYSGENCFGYKCFDIPCFNSNSFIIAINRICAMNFFESINKKYDISNSDISLNSIIIDNNIKETNIKETNIKDNDIKNNDFKDNDKKQPENNINNTPVIVNKENSDEEMSDFEII